MNNAISSALSLTPLILAQAPTVGATELGQWLLVGAAVAVIANQGFTFFRNITSQFAKKNAAPGEAQISITDCDKKHEGINKKFETQRQEWEQHRKDMHERINKISENVAFIRGKFEGG